jgi:TM2 domain-containing membrane protein YozV
MNCAVHTDTPATAFCRTCGKALCENCKRDVMGAIYCEPCLAARLQSAPAPAGRAAAPGAYASAPSGPMGAPRPAVAFWIGFIPGVGAMYNGQFAKAIVHVVVFVMLIVATDNVSDLFGLGIAFWLFYMAFEAYKTAEAKRLGQPLPDPLGLDRMFGIQEHQHTTAAAAGASAPASTAPFGVPASALPPSEGAPPVGQQNLPTGAIVLIGLGVLFLLSNFGIFSMRHFWPLVLIGVGLWIAYKHSVRPQP